MKRKWLTVLTFKFHVAKALYLFLSFSFQKPNQRFGDDGRSYEPTKISRLTYAL